MADIENLEGVAQLLPPERRERFLFVIQKYKTVPQDDDHLVMLEAMGFIALFMKELPAEISKLLDQAGKALTEDQADRLGTQFTEVLTTSMDTPSFKELGDIVRTIRETHEKAQRDQRKLLNGLGRAEITLTKHNRFLPNLTTGLASALLALAIGGIAAFFVLPPLLEPEPITIPKQLWPYVELQRQGRLDHFDKSLPNYANGEEVRILRVERDVIDAFKDGTGAVVVIRKAASTRR